MSSSRRRLTQLPFGDEELSGVITVNTIYFVTELDRAFAELSRVVNRSGRIVIGLADPDAMEKMPTSGHVFTCVRCRNSWRPCVAPDWLSTTAKSTGVTSRPTC